MLRCEDLSGWIKGTTEDSWRGSSFWWRSGWAATVQTDLTARGGGERWESSGQDRDGAENNFWGNTFFLPLPRGEIPIRSSGHIPRAMAQCRRGRRMKAPRLFARNFLSKRLRLSCSSSRATMNRIVFSATVPRLVHRREYVAEGSPTNYRVSRGPLRALLLLASCHCGFFLGFS